MVLSYIAYEIFNHGKSSKCAYPLKAASEFGTLLLEIIEFLTSKQKIPPFNNIQQRLSSDAAVCILFFPTVRDTHFLTFYE